MQSKRFVGIFCTVEFHNDACRGRRQGVWGGGGWKNASLSHTERGAKALKKVAQRGGGGVRGIIIIINGLGQPLSLQANKQIQIIGRGGG